MTLNEPAKTRTSHRQDTLRLGVRAHDFGRLTVEKLAARIAAAGFTCVQLALNKAIAGLNLRAGDLTGEMARDLAAAFDLHGIRIEVLGCYINPIHPDPAELRRGLDFFKDHLRYARDFGCNLVALESGSFNADYSPHPANHAPEAIQQLLLSLTELVAAAENYDVCVGLEAVTPHTVASAPAMSRVLNTLRSDHLRVVLDPVNLLSPENFRDQSRIVAEALDLLGDKIAVIHAKDFVRADGLLKTVPAGRGELDFAPVLKFIRESSSGVAMLLEEAGTLEAEECAGYLRKQFELLPEDL